MFVFGMYVLAPPAKAGLVFYCFDTGGRTLLYIVVPARRTAEAGGSLTATASLIPAIAYCAKTA